MTTTTLTFSESDLFNSPLIASNGGVCYQITTEKNRLWMRKTTTVTPIYADGTPVPNAPSGVIHWKDHTMGVGQRVVDWKELKTTKSIWRSEREWRWSSTPYSIKFGWNEWTIKPQEGKDPLGYGNISTAAVFKLYHWHLTKPSEPAHIDMSDSVPVEDRLFLLLVMLYSEAKRQDRQRTATAASSSAAASSAAAAAAS